MSPYVMCWKKTYMEMKEEEENQRNKKCKSWREKKKVYHF
jgi:hypothetical protein